MVPFFLLLAAPARGAQTLVPQWVVDELEQRVRREPTAEDLHDLAELWARIAEDEEQKALALHVAAFDACVDESAADPTLPRSACEELHPDLDPALKAWRHAETRSSQLLRDHPDDLRVPDAVSRLGWAWRRLGEDSLSDAAFTWVGASSEDAAQAQLAWTQVGDAAFARWNHTEALVAYQLAAEEEGRLTAWVLHRRGWTLYRQGEYGAAIDTMKALVGRSMEAESRGEIDTFDLKEEALEDLLRFYADAGELDSHCYGPCKLGSQEEIYAMLERLASVYDQQGKHQEAIQTRRRLIASNPDSLERNAEYQAQIVSSYSALGHTREVLTELDRFLTRYPDQLEIQAARLGQGLRDSALRLHEEGLVHGDPERLNQARALYELHLDHIAAWKHEVGFWRATVLEDLGHTQEALSAYQENLEAFPNSRYTLLAKSAVQRLSAE